MKTLQLRFSSIGIAICVVLMSIIISCKKEDSSKPTIDYLFANSDPGEHLHGFADTTNIFEVSVTDDEILFQVMLQMSSPTGFHSHEEGSDLSLTELTFQSPNIGKWDTTAIVNLNTQSAIETFVLNAPDSISGGWKARLAVLDHNGNLTQKDYILHVFNDNLPRILADSIQPAPDETGMVYLSTSQNLHLFGDITDFDTLQHVEISILKGNDTLQSQTWSDINSWSFPMEQIVFEPIAETGLLYLYIRAVDMMGWQYWKRVRITTTN